MKKARKKYRFLLLVPYTYPDYSGSGRNAFNFGKFLVKRNIPVKLVTLNRNLKYAKYEQINGLLVSRISYLNKNVILKIFSLVWIIPIYIYMICTSNIIYVYGKNLIAWQFIIIFSKLCRKKIIFRSLMFGEDDIESLLSAGNYLVGAFNKFLLKHTDCYFSIHPGFSDSYREIIGTNNRLLEIPQGVDTEVFYPVSIEEKKKIRRKLELPEKGFIIISIAFLILRKGFIEIFQQLNHLQIPYKYLIIGEYDFGENHFLSHKKDEAISISDKGLEFLGSKLLLIGPKENVNEYLQASDLCLFNSKAEGLPNSMLEAMASGIPVVTNSITGLNGYLLQHEKNSIVFEQTNEINYWIEKMYHNPEMKTEIVKGAITTIRHIGNFDNILNRILNILEFEK